MPNDHDRHLAEHDIAIGAIDQRLLRVAELQAASDDRLNRTLDVLARTAVLTEANAAAIEQLIDTIAGHIAAPDHTKETDR